MSELSVGALRGLAANSFEIDIASGSTLDLANAKAGSIPRAALPTGSILQVVQTIKTDTFSTTTTSFTDVTGLSATITPRSASNRIYVMVSVQASNQANIGLGAVQLMRDSTAISIGDAAGSRRRASAHLNTTVASVQPTCINFLDSPNTTSAITYKVQITADRASTAVHVNRSNDDADSLIGIRTASSIILMEVAG